MGPCGAARPFLSLSLFSLAPSLGYLGAVPNKPTLPPLPPSLPPLTPYPLSLTTYPSTLPFYYLCVPSHAPPSPPPSALGFLAPEWMALGVLRAGADPSVLCPALTSHFGFHPPTFPKWVHAPSLTTSAPSLTNLPSLPPLPGAIPNYPPLRKEKSSLQ